MKIRSLKLKPVSPENAEPRVIREIVRALGPLLNIEELRGALFHFEGLQMIPWRAKFFKNSGRLYVVYLKDNKARLAALVDVIVHGDEGWALEEEDLRSLGLELREGTWHDSE